MRIPGCDIVRVYSAPAVFQSGFSEQLNQGEVELAAHEWEEAYDSDYDADNDDEVYLIFYDDMDAAHFSCRAASLRLPSWTQTSKRRIPYPSK